MFVDDKPHGEPVRTNEAWQEIICRAIQVLERDGWCQGVRQDMLGRRCVVGALYADAGSADYLKGQPNSRYEAIRRIENALGGPHQILYIWNDVPGRTVDEVIAKLKETIDVQ